MSDHVPSLRQKKTNYGNYAVVTLPDGLGRRRDVLLGRCDSKEGRQACRVEYKRVIAKWKEAGQRLSEPTSHNITITELIVQFLPWAESHYRCNGRPTTEVTNFRYSLRPLRHLCGDSRAAEFGPRALKAVRELMVSGYVHPKYGPQEPLSRRVINQRVKRIRRMFRWAVENELVPLSIYHGLQAVRELQHGRTNARELPPVRPVARAVVEETLPLLRSMVADMVRLQLATGMRSGELVAMRPCDIDMTGKVWLYRPVQHKTAHHGHEKLVALGPAAQEIIRRHLTTDTQSPVFSPARSMEERRVALRAKRKTKVQPSQVTRAKAQPRKRPGAAYTATSYCRSIADAIKRHNDGKPESDHLPHWHPHQIRHLRALELKRQFGLDVARAVLGHRSPVLTEFYAGVDAATAADVMGRVG